MSKPACRYGAKCYQSNPQHLQKYSHPQTKCKFGSVCDDETLLHLSKFSHPDTNKKSVDEEEEEVPPSVVTEDVKTNVDAEEIEDVILSDSEEVESTRKACTFGKYCYRTAKEHRKQFVHPRDEVLKLRNKK